jgi:hypothetical protein
MTLDAAVPPAVAAAPSSSRFRARTAHPATTSAGRLSRVARTHAAGSSVLQRSTRVRGAPSSTQAPAATGRRALAPLSTLFIDCGNTLITWNRVFNARGEEAWQVNWDVAAAIERWQVQQLGEVVIWSEMGAEDAERWARRAVPHLAVKCRIKDSAVIQPGDTAIDDVSLVGAGVSYRPGQSFMIAPVPPGEAMPTIRAP